VSTPWSRGRVKEETELEGGFCKVLVRHGNSAVTLFQLIKMIGAFLQIRQRARAGAYLFSVQVGPTWASSDPTLFIAFLFLFLPGFKNF
jgi:hypothetical protein